MAAGRRARSMTPRRAAAIAATWAIGVAIGVALGGWLTVTSGNGAPGAAALDPGRDLLLIPLLSGVVVFAVLFAGLLLFALVARGRSASQVDDA